MSELKTCPFCRKKPRIKHDFNSENKEFYQLRHDCMNLLTEIKTFCCSTEEEAITAWNQRVNLWIPVSEGKPYKKSCHYLVLSKMNWAHGGTWEDNNGDARRNMAVAYFDCTGKFNVPYVTHWMPLPAPPEEVLKSEDKA